MNILYVINSLGFGGAETQLFNLVRAAVARRYQVNVVILHSCDVVHIEKFNALNVKIINLGMSRGVPNPYYIFKLYRVISKIRPSVIHSHIAQANIITRLANLNRYKLISTAHNYSEGSKFIDFLYKITDRLSCITTNVSYKAVKRYNDDGLVRGGKCIYVPNGIDIDYFKSSNKLSIANLPLFINNDVPVLLAVGRLCEQKNYELMLDVMQKVNANLVIIGAGPEERKIRDLINIYKLGDKVVLLGTKSDLRPFYLHCDALLMTSLWEGLPIVLLESLAMEMPVISTNVSGADEILPKAKCGLILSDFDSKVISTEVNQFLATKNLKNLGELGREYISDNYSITSVFKKWEVIYFGDFK